MISTAEVARLAHRLGVGDRVIEKDYVLSWLLAAIAESDLRGKLAFAEGGWHRPQAVLLSRLSLLRRPGFYPPR